MRPSTSIVQHLHHRSITGNLNKKVGLISIFNQILPLFIRKECYRLLETLLSDKIDKHKDNAIHDFILKTLKLGEFEEPSMLFDYSLDGNFHLMTRFGYMLTLYYMENSFRIELKISLDKGENYKYYSNFMRCIIFVDNKNYNISDVQVEVKVDRIKRVDKLDIIHHIFRGNLMSLTELNLEIIDSIKYIIDGGIENGVFNHSNWWTLEFNTPNKMKRAFNDLFNTIRRQEQERVYNNRRIIRENIFSENTRRMFDEMDEMDIQNNSKRPRLQSGSVRQNTLRFTSYLLNCMRSSLFIKI